MAGLDPRGRAEILALIESLREKNGTGIVMVSHSMDDVAMFADRIAVLGGGTLAMLGTPEEVCRQALDNDVHLIGISTLAGGHKTLVPELIRCLREAGAAHVRVSVGGIIPDGDHAFLHEVGVAAVFGPGSRLPDCAHVLLDSLDAP